MTDIPEKWFHLLPIEGQPGLFRRSDGGVVNLRDDDFRKLFERMVDEASTVDQRLHVDRFRRVLLGGPPSISEHVDPSQKQLVRALAIFQMETEDRLTILEQELLRAQRKIFE